MPDFPLFNQPHNSSVIGTWSPEVGLFRAMNSDGGLFGLSNIWPVANLALFIPVEIFEPTTIAKMAINNGATVSGNFDLGIYAPSGKQLVSSGSVAQSGASAIQSVDITDTLLVPGLYYMALVFDNITATLTSWSSVAAQEMRLMGLLQAASAFALPAPVTFATYAQTLVPLITMNPKATY